MFQRVSNHFGMIAIDHLLGLVLGGQIYKRCQTQPGWHTKSSCLKYIRPIRATSGIWIIRHIRNAEMVLKFYRQLIHYLGSGRTIAVVICVCARFLRGHIGYISIVMKPIQHLPTVQPFCRRPPRHSAGVFVICRPYRSIASLPRPSILREPLFEDLEI